MKKNNVVHFFNCPVHGLRNDVLCFRAFDIKNKHLWAKYNIKFIKLLTTKEINKIIESILEDEKE